MQVEAAAEIVEEIGAVFRKWRLPLETGQAQAFAFYLQLLERWNKTTNLTSIRERRAAILRHFAEPAMAMQKRPEQRQPRAPDRVLQEHHHAKREERRGSFGFVGH